VRARSLKDNPTTPPDLSVATNEYYCQTIGHKNDEANALFRAFERRREYTVTSLSIAIFDHKINESWHNVQHWIYRNVQQHFATFKTDYYDVFYVLLQCDTVN
jgi:hypothetical protein